MNEFPTLLADWQAFIHSGFDFAAFSPDLYRYLTMYCSFISHYDRHRFWEHYFDSDAARLSRFLNQFGGDRLSAEYGRQSWSQRPGEAADLNQQLCQTMAQVYPTLQTALRELISQQYEAEKWAYLQNQAQSGQASAQAIALLGQQYERAIKRADFFDYFMVIAEVRQYLREALASATAPQSQACFLDALPALRQSAWQAVTQNGTVAQIAHLTLRQAEEALTVSEASLQRQRRLAYPHLLAQAEPEAQVQPAEQKQQRTKHLTLSHD